MTMTLLAKSLLGGFLLLGTTQHTNAQDIPFFAGDPNFLFLGNSYTGWNSLSQTVQSIMEDGIPQWRERVMERAINPGGKTLGGHYRDALDTSGNSLQRQALITQPEAWKWVTLQDQSQVPGFWEWDWEGTEFYNSRTAAVGLNNLIDDLGGQTMFLMTWGRREGDRFNSDIYPDFLAMQERLTEGYYRYVDETTTNARPTYVAPAGLVFETIYNDEVDPLAQGTLFRSLYQQDGSHPSMAGTYLAALTLYTSMTGRDPKDINWFPDNLDPVDGRLIQDAVSRTILSTFNSEEIVYPWTTAFPADASVSQPTTPPPTTPTTPPPTTPPPTTPRPTQPPTTQPPTTPNPVPSGNSRGSITIDFDMDEYPEEISWALLPDNGGAPLYFQPYESGVTPYELLTETFDGLEPGKRYLFKVSDVEGDGLCCDHGQGSFTITDNVGGRTLFVMGGRGFQSYMELDIEILPNGHSRIAHKSGHYRPSTWAELEDQMAPANDPEWPGMLPSSDLYSLVVNVDIDDHPEDVSWTLYHSSNGQWNQYATWNGNAGSAGSIVSTEFSDLPGGWYRFVIRDSQQNGLCCDFGNGFVSLTGPLEGSPHVPNSAGLGLVWGNNGQFLDEDEIYFLMGGRSGTISHISWKF